MASSTLFQQVVRKYLVSLTGTRPDFYDILKSCRTQRLGWFCLAKESRDQLSTLAAQALLKCEKKEFGWSRKISVWVPPTPRKWLLGILRELVLELVHKEDEALPIVADWIEDHGEYPRAEVLRLYLQEKENRDG